MLKNRPFEFVFADQLEKGDEIRIYYGGKARKRQGEADFRITKEPRLANGQVTIRTHKVGTPPSGYRAVYEEFWFWARQKVKKVAG